MTIDLNVPANWKTTLGGLVGGALAVLYSYIQSGQHINPKDPMFWMGFVIAVKGYYEKDKNVTGGTKLAAGAVPDATLHAEQTPKA